MKFSSEFNSKNASISQSPSKNIINNIKFDFNFQEIHERKKSFEIREDRQFSILDTNKAFKNNYDSSNLSKLDTYIVNDFSCKNKRDEYVHNSSAGKQNLLANKKFRDKNSEVFFLLARSK